ncbi:peptide ABC transporter substrate-binding protein [Lysinibacillus sphaericus]|uniref:oligopeptide ABC transporter substrate-binding protein n=1 Tax=Lysinibacillus sphaericus TaxID=1421 RepID=UPI0018CCDE5A|nr:oligopeptide ABC transporter substrate-binding protein [Lysinibacillus sphaericus]MBG9455107.1 peptide ABC transporter substrate-binding protein [Lysinibacillus sphaericus]MBG9478651.1 peptide ABC transporter substrate-binding protein [Lysinibacillus sphaericus]MBG9592378.1 peptide ABC transporter substrate-binding protein [Lysinibacillus sphaericus]
MKKSALWSFMLMLVMALFLAACNSDNSTTDKDKEKDKGDSTKTSETAKGGVVTFGTDQAPEGVYDPAFSGSIVDSYIQNFTTDGIYDVNDNLEYVPNLATWDISEDKLTYTFNLKKGVKWHNGEELTADDWVFALETLADKDYDGPRYNYVENIKGAAAKKAGKADKIEGIEVVDPYTVKITFEKVKINNLENLWQYPMPKKHYEGIAVKDLGESKQVRENPVGVGPFKVKKVVDGEYSELERFDDYWKGKPQLDGVIVKVIDPSLAAGAFQNGEIDIMDIKPQAVKELSALDNVRIEETNGVSYSYIGLRFGHRDKATLKNVADFDKFKSKELRQALLYAINRPAMIDAFLEGKADVANTVVPRAFWTAAKESDLNKYEYNAEKAKELLKSAGYVDTDGDGFVEDPKGKPFKISFGHYAGPAAFEGRSQAIIQAWNDIGVKTELATGTLIEFNLYNDMKDNDDAALEAFFGSWSTGADPDPSGLWGNDAEWNYGRYVDAKNQDLLEKGLNEEAFDKDKRMETYVEWQKYFNEELPALPLWENLDLYGINNRLQGVHINAVGFQTDVYKWHIKE